MSHRRFQRAAGVALVVATLLVVAVTPALAAVTLQTETSYDGTDADSQAIDASVTLSPNGSKITDVRVDIDETQRAFVNFDSFSRSVDPGTADPEITYQGDGVYTIDELEVGEQVTITFDAYPRTIKKETIPVATVTVDYVQNGQDLTDSTTLTANLTNSSWFALQESQQRAQQLQSENEQLRSENENLSSENERLRNKNEELQNENENLREENERLQSRIERNQTWVLVAQGLIALIVLGTLVFGGLYVYDNYINVGTSLEGDEEEDDGDSRF